MNDKMNNNKLKKEIVKIVNSQILNISKKEIGFLYNSWFNGLGTKDKWIQNKKVINEKLNVPEKAYLRGIDLPFYFGNIETANKRVMIVGLDPLRHPSAFEEAKDSNGKVIGANIQTDVLLGTPYALHLMIKKESEKESKKKSKYRTIIENLQKDNFVYLTDLYKTFFRVKVTSKEIRSYDYFRKKDINTNSLEILLNEINLVDPHIIITFGSDIITKLTGKKVHSLSKKKVVKTFCNHVENIPILPLVHPAAWNSHLNDFFEANEIDVRKPDFDYGVAFSELIERHLSYD
ncbi:uracil-DNA glycosylase family protein [Tamlana crocina]